MKNCKAIIQFGDDYADNCCTFHCQLKSGHKGKHQERGDMKHGEESVPYFLEWEGSSEEE